MPRYKLTVEYDGQAFVGWQRQENGVAVQQALEEAAAKLCGQAVAVTGAGRTDAGVHALAQVAHLDLPRPFPLRSVRDGLNFHVRPHPVGIVRAEEVDETFHARFSARERAYVYRILNRPSPPVLDRGRVWWVARPLDAARMHEAAQVLVGQHDFTSFRATMCQAASPIKTVSALDVVRQGDEIQVFARAPSFLHHQVRNFAGTLKLVGEGKWGVEDVARALAARDRAQAGPTAPPEGLYLKSVGY